MLTGDGGCECGCGQQTTLYRGKRRRWIRGHWRRVPVDQLYAVDDCGYETPCWVWELALDGKGYGVYAFGGKVRRAHHFFYVMEHGAIPAGLELDHLCCVPACVRPSHLEAVTHAENMRRMSERITHCKRGHEFTTENTYRNPGNGRRQCLPCMRARYKRQKSGSRSDLAIDLQEIVSVGNDAQFDRLVELGREEGGW